MNKAKGICTVLMLVIGLGSSLFARAEETHDDQFTFSSNGVVGTFEYGIGKRVRPTGFVFELGRTWKLHPNFGVGVVSSYSNVSEDSRWVDRDDHSGVYSWHILTEMEAFTTAFQQAISFNISDWLSIALNLDLGASYVIKYQDWSYHEETSDRFTGHIERMVVLNPYISPGMDILFGLSKTSSLGFNVRYIPIMNRFEYLTGGELIRVGVIFQERF